MIHHARYLLLLGVLALAPLAGGHAEDAVSADDMKIGIIGLDTSHAIRFTQLLNDPRAGGSIAGCRVVAAYPPGSPDIESSTSRREGYTRQIRDMGIEIVDSIDDLLTKVDAVLLETNDGRPHLEQVLPVLEAKKPVFIDKPTAGTLADVVAIYRLARRHDVPVFSSSSLRYTEGAQSIRQGAIGEVIGCDAFSPCPVEPTHPDLFWYGIHGVETLFTVMGTGCESVSRVHTEPADVVVGTWAGGRIGTFRGIRLGQSGYGGTAFGSKVIKEIGPSAGYQPLVERIVAFFRSGKPPVAAEETIEIYAFMEAADESRRRDGAAVRVADVLAAAERQATERIERIEAP